MLKVCHMTSVHRSDDVRIFQKECVSLATAGYEVYLVAQGESQEEKGVHIVGIGEKPAKRLKRMTAFARKVYQKALELNCEIYHVHDPELLPYALKLKRRGKKVIFDSHEFYGLQIKEKHYLNPLIRNMVASAYMAYERYVCLRLNAVVAVCTVDGRDYFEGRTRNVAFITNAPIVDIHGGKIPKWSDNDVPTVVYAGSLTRDRGISILAEAAYKAGCKLLLCGTFSSEEYKDKLLSGEYGGSIDYRGHVSAKELEEIYRESHIGGNVIQDVGQYAHCDTFATKVYEYMMHELPAIVSDFSNCRKTIEQYGYGLCVNPQDADEVTKAIRYLLEHPDEAKRMGENGRRAVEQEFNWSIEEKKLIALYELLGTK